jgi:hypothetical protein
MFSWLKPTSVFIAWHESRAFAASTDEITPDLQSILRNLSFFTAL